MPVLILLIVLLGLLAGGLVNVLADDLPQRRSPRLPRYPDGTPRPLAAWLGVTAFLLGKRSSPDGASLSWRYPLAELGTATLMVLTLLVKNDMPGVTSLQMGIWLLYMAIFVLITVIDIEHKLILFIVIIPSILLGLVDAAFVTSGRDFGSAASLTDGLLGGATGFGVFFIMYNGGFVFTYVLGKMRGEEIQTVAFGYGDVMMATFSGVVLGFGAVVLAMFITVFLGAFGAFAYLVTRTIIMQRGYSMYTALPYGPYIVIGTIIMLLYGEQVRALLMIGSR